MNYRHIYHAGNFGDVLKHVVLIALIQSLQRKDSPFCVLDTHAGIGAYDLTSDAAQKSNESARGISLLLQSEPPTALLQDYLRCVTSFNEGTPLKTYPGSPAIAKHFLRPQDKVILCELHEEDYQTAKKYFRNDKQVAVHLQDAYLGLKAFLPPPEKRGIILIDPPYEKHDEYDALLRALPLALQRFQQGVFALWYPIKDHRSSDRFIAMLRNKITQPTLNVELSVYPTITPNQLNGSGVLIINPPYQLQATLETALPWLWNQLSQKNLGQWQLN